MKGNDDKTPHFRPFKIGNASARFLLMWTLL